MIFLGRAGGRADGPGSVPDPSLSINEAGEFGLKTELQIQTMSSKYIFLLMIISITLIITYYYLMKFIPKHSSLEPQKYPEYKSNIPKFSIYDVYKFSDHYSKWQNYRSFTSYS